MPAAPPAVPAFAIGIDEHNPHLIAPGPQPAPFARFRDALAALDLTYVRVQVDWAAIQPEAGRPPDWAQPGDGCDRGAPPCSPWNGIRDTLRAVRARGAQVVIVLYGTPPWAAQRPAGCAAVRAEPFARMPRLAPYRAMVRSLLALARAEHLDLPYWSAWNEPNLPYFLVPQGAACAARATSQTAGGYARLARALAGIVGAGHLLLGEASGIGDGHRTATGAAALASALPGDLVCGAAAWAQHAYVSAPHGTDRRLLAVAPEHTATVVSAVEQALAVHGCDHRVPVWITETGAGDRPGACAAMAAQLRAWRGDPQIAAAFQYTMRDDPSYPTGLADQGLTRLYPAYEAWRTRGAGGCPT